MLWVVLGVATFATLAAAGYLIGVAVSSPGVASRDLPTPSNCDDFCNVWKQARGMVCIAQSNLASAASWYNSCQQLFYAAAAAAAVAIAIATAASFIPFIGPAIAAPLFAAAGIAASLAASMYAMMMGAGLALTQKQSELNNAQNAAAMAAMDVSSHCARDAASACFASPPPC